MSEYFPFQVRLLKQGKILPEVEPLYMHDCEECVYIGRGTWYHNDPTNPENWGDIYVHLRVGTTAFTEFLCRFGNEGGQYYCRTVYTLRDLLSDPKFSQWVCQILETTFFENLYANDTESCKLLKLVGYLHFQVKED